MKKNIFEPTTIAGITFKNHIIRSATHEGFADQKGNPTDAHKKLYVDLAKGGVGGIITGYSGVTMQGKSDNLGMMMIDTDESIPYYKDIVDAVHSYGTPIILQIAHAGRQTTSKATGFKPVAPSALRDKFYTDEKATAATINEIEEIIEAFLKSSKRAQDAGFDGVQLHIAHGYLLSSFLSSNANHRKDEWGGSLTNRYRIIDRIIKGIKANQPGFPVFVKLNGFDLHKNGMRPEEAVEIAKLLEASGCDAIEVSNGVIADGFSMTRGEKIPTEALLAYSPKFKDKNKFIKKALALLVPYVLPMAKPTTHYNVDVASQIKQAISIPVIVVGGIKTIEGIESIINSSQADLVSMSKAFICEKDIVHKFETGKSKSSRCIDCNYCLMGVPTLPLRCHYGKIKTK